MKPKPDDENDVDVASQCHDGITCGSEKVLCKMKGWQAEICTLNHAADRGAKTSFSTALIQSSLPLYGQGIFKVRSKRLPAVLASRTQ
jgi:hypothetical protein